jgi:hypothetical protein
VAVLNRCDPMRVTKKFAGKKFKGKSLYRGATPTIEKRMKQQQALDELEV